jgi:hypothetical protein
MNETRIDYQISPDRKKLLWLLLRKRGIDFEPQQIDLSEYAKGQIKKESQPESVKQNQQEDLIPDDNGDV